MKESPNLDVLRSIAVGLVVGAHMRDFLPWWGWTYDLYSMGRLGISLFFVHTTLVLMMSLERNGGAPVPFFIRRLFRIYPLAIVSVMCMAAVGAMGNVPIDPVGFVSNLLLIQNITGHLSAPAQLWTLPYEVQMYLFLPALYVATKSRKPLLWTAGICGLALTVTTIGWAAGADLFVFEFVPCFLPGMLAYVLWGRVRQRFSPILLFAGIALSVPAVTALVTAGVPMKPLFWVYCLALGIILPMVRPLPNGWLAKCGYVVAKYSYGIYLTHVVALGIGFSLMSSYHWTVQWLVFSVMLAGLARVAYRFIEAPGIRVGVWLANHRAKAPIKVVSLT
jgi:peptidoglycan/LPS O-acetylase OafA/YrhL